MSKYSVQLKDLRVKLGQRDGDISDFKAKVETPFIHVGIQYNLPNPTLIGTGICFRIKANSGL